MNESDAGDGTLPERHALTFIARPHGDRVAIEGTWRSTHGESNSERAFELIVASGVPFALVPNDGGEPVLELLVRHATDGDLAPLDGPWQRASISFE